MLGELGLNATTAITMYYEQIVRRHAIPFDVSLPTKTTLDAMHDAETRRGLAQGNGDGISRDSIELSNGL